MTDKHASLSERWITRRFVFQTNPLAFGRNAHSRLAVHDDKAAYFVRMFDSLQGLDPKVYFTPGRKGYLLFAQDKATGKQTWSQRIGVRVNAMVVTHSVLFAIDPARGERMWKHELPVPPVFNGLIAAAGRLCVAMQDGKIACFGK